MPNSLNLFNLYHLVPSLPVISLYTRVCAYARKDNYPAMMGLDGTRSLLGPSPLGCFAGNAEPHMFALPNDFEKWESKHV